MIISKKDDFTMEMELMNDFLNLSKKRIVVVGASSGIGRQTAITLSKQGALLVLMARREDKLKETLSELEGSGHVYYCADFSDLDSLDEVFKTLTAEQGKIDGLVYSAGITMDLPLKMFIPSKLETIFKVNFFGFAECVRQITKKGRFNPGMRIVGVSSVASMIGKKADMGYSASKGAINSAIRSMSIELADKDICINAVAPGMINTKMYRDFVEQNGVDSEANQYIMKRQYLGIGEVEDVANVITFLLSPASRFITGIVIPVDGGRTTS